MHKHAKVTDSEFAGKSLFSQNKCKKGPKMCIMFFFLLLSKLNHYFFLEITKNEVYSGWLTFCANPWENSRSRDLGLKALDQSNHLISQDLLNCSIISIKIDYYNTFEMILIFLKKSKNSKICPKWTL